MEIAETENGLVVIRRADSEAVRTAARHAGLPRLRAFAVIAPRGFGAVQMGELEGRTATTGTRDGTRARTSLAGFEDEQSKENQSSWCN
jgi:hypothetical protein